ncbi:hypothetical protein HGRIS_005405 [Hohenbuehelia grisea]|uniref:CxC2-like cysteine cluster KDZ transposase-associated domain-containing protein n=1 Tax=Hohenbuehelia grisea TaxID=104357 RepID=A0ABR3JFJ4_9AGAR
MEQSVAVSAMLPDTPGPDLTANKTADGDFNDLEGTSAEYQFTQDDVPPHTRYESSDAPMKTWLPFREEYLDELSRWSGRGGSSSRCPAPCGKPAAFRCKDCCLGQLLCSACVVKHHQGMPLHRIQEWSLDHARFDRRSLSELGLTVQFGHAMGRPCARRQSATKDFVVLHLNGIHKISVFFCHCQHPEVPHHVQLLRAGFWPAP